MAWMSSLEEELQDASCCLVYSHSSQDELETNALFDYCTILLVVDAVVDAAQGRIMVNHTDAAAAAAAADAVPDVGRVCSCTGCPSFCPMEMHDLALAGKYSKPV